MRLRSLLYVATSAVGARYAIQRGETARVAGIRLPGSATQHAASIGTSLSAPPVMLALVLYADRTNRGRLTKILGALALAGILAEADTWTTLLHPTHNPTRSMIVGAEILLPIALLSTSDAVRG